MENPQGTPEPDSSQALEEIVVKDEAEAQAMVNYIAQQENISRFLESQKRRANQAIALGETQPQQIIRNKIEYAKVAAAGRGKRLVVQVNVEELVGSRPKNPERVELFRMAAGGSYISIVAAPTKRSFMRKKLWIATDSGFSELHREDMVELCALLQILLYGKVGRIRKKHSSKASKYDDIIEIGESISRRLRKKGIPSVPSTGDIKDDEV